MISADTYKNYIRDLIFQLKDDLKSRKPTNEFEEGQKFEMESILYRIENQAIAFNINLDEMGFFDFEKSQWFDPLLIGQFSRFLN